MQRSNGALNRWVHKKEIWVPTWRGVLVLGLCVFMVGFVFVRGVYSFLALNAPIGGQILIVESWLSEKDLAVTAGIFRKGGYEEVITAGPLLAQDSFLKWRYPHLTSHGDVTKTQLIDAGLPDTLIHVVIRPEVKTDRTYHTAVALKRWLDQNRPTAHLDILSVGPHARRTWLLYALAFDGGYPLGVIAQAPKGYVATQWWQSSEGVRSVVGELLAYCYAKFIFYP